MKFHLLDKIETISDEQIVAIKAVSQSEEYLADHFPTFPVLPGVMMLEAAIQAAAWLAFRRTQFACTVAVLKSARNIRYGHFVAPGRALRISASYDKPTESGHIFKIEGTVQAGLYGGDTRTAITGKLELACFRLGDRNPERAEVDERLIRAHRARWANLTLSDPSLSL